MGYVKFIIGTLLAVNALVQIFQNKTWWFIQNVNLIFHEAGHIIFMFFGDFMSILGGSLLEILIPLIVTLHFFFTKQFFSAAFSSWWLSTAFLSVSIYASDAEERFLPLLGGDSVLHDWFYILSQLNLLEHDDLFGYFFWLCAFLSVVLLIFFLSKDKDIRTLFHSHRLR